MKERNRGEREQGEKVFSIFFPPCRPKRQSKKNNKNKNKKKDARTSEVRHRVQELDDLLPHERGPGVDPVCGPADLRVAEAPCLLLMTS